MKRNKDYNKKQGLKYYRRKDYVRAVSFLEKALREKKDDATLYLFLGYASIFTGDIDGARRYFKGGLLVKEDDIELLKGLSYIYIKDERIEDAISLWGEILEKNPKERIVKRALERLRATEDIKDFVERANIRDFFFPRLPFIIKLKPYLLGIAISVGVIIFGVIFYTTPLYKRTLEKFYPEIVNLKGIELPDDVPVTQEENTSALYSFTDKEIEESFIRVKKYIYKNKVNAAIILLNKIVLSNATQIVKERFDILYKFIEPPDPLSIDYNPHFYEIMKEPAVFNGVYVLWTGRIANLKKDKERADFDLLVNYEDQDTIEGIAHVSIDGVYYIENKQKIEVFGYYQGYDVKTGKLMINGMLLRDLGL